MSDRNMEEVQYLPFTDEKYLGLMFPLEDLLYMNECHVMQMVHVHCKKIITMCYFLLYIEIL